MSLCGCVCVFAGVHNDAKTIQCHWRVKGVITIRVVWGSAVGNAWEGDTRFCRLYGVKLDRN